MEIGQVVVVAQRSFEHQLECEGRRDAERPERCGESQSYLHITISIKVRVRVRVSARVRARVRASASARVRIRFRVRVKTFEPLMTTGTEPGSDRFYPRLWPSSRKSLIG